MCIHLHKVTVTCEHSTTVKFKFTPCGQFCCSDCCSRAYYKNYGDSIPKWNSMWTEIVNVRYISALRFTDKLTFSTVVYFYSSLRSTKHFETIVTAQQSKRFSPQWVIKCIRTQWRKSNLRFSCLFGFWSSLWSEFGLKRNGSKTEGGGGSRRKRRRARRPCFFRRMWG